LANTVASYGLIVASYTNLFYVLKNSVTGFVGFGVTKLNFFPGYLLNISQYPVALAYFSAMIDSDISFSPCSMHGQ